MSQYPIVDKEDLIDGVNYLLSGPSGLGQNFEGFSDFNTAYLTGNYRAPFTQITPVDFTLQPIDLSDAELLDPFTWKFTFVSAQPTAPFPLGSPIFVNGVNPDDYDGQYQPIGVVECTTTYVIARTRKGYTAPPYVSGGNVDFNITSITNISEPLPLSIANIAYYSPSNLRVTLSNTLTSVPFNNYPEDFVTISGINSSYNGTWQVYASTTSTIDIVSEVTARYPGGGYLTPEFLYNSTDCTALITVFGGTDRVFISAQLNNTISYTTTSGGNLCYIISINRYVGTPNEDPVNPGYIFTPDGTTSQRIYNYSGLTGSGTLDNVETIFSTVIDQPNPGYYRYILEVAFVTDTDVFVTQSQLGLRSLSAQVVKE